MPWNLLLLPSEEGSSRRYQPFRLMPHGGVGGGLRGRRLTVSLVSVHVEHLTLVCCPHQGCVAICVLCIYSYWLMKLLISCDPLGNGDLRYTIKA
jgi:hypothetical protein